MNLKHDLKTIVKSPSKLDCIKSGGIAVYIATTEDGTQYQYEIDLSDKHDVGETATFLPHYDKAMILMRWIRRAIDNNTIIKLS